MSGSIFRRGGQKAEAHGSPSEQQISNTQLETKLAALQQGWSAPLTASTQSLAVWRPEHGGAEVAIERGNVLQRMGYRHRRKLYLHVEEAVYMVSRGSLLLSAVDGIGQQQLLSLHEATQLMVSAGVSIAQYQVYCHLVQAGYIVTRHPAVWVLDDEQDPQQVWGSESTMEKQPLLQDAYEHAAIPFADRVGQAWPDVQASSWLSSDVASSSCLPPLKRFKQSPAEPQEDRTNMHMHWWPAALPSSVWNPAELHDMQDDLPRCLVVEEEPNIVQVPFLPRLKPFPVIQHMHYANAMKIPDSLKLVYDVLKPNKRFSKVKPDASKLVVCLSTGSNLPPCSIIHRLQAATMPLPLQLARVSGGEVSFHNLQDLS